MKLDDRLTELGRLYAGREAAEAEALARAWECAHDLHGRVSRALASFHRAAGEGVPQLMITQSAPRADDKHLHSVQFDIARGRSRAIVTVKSRGDVTLVGPFHAGKAEGPCRTFPVGAAEPLDRALIEFLEKFLEEAFRP
ncbi:MAG: hypothetical protein OSB70_14245 [Myxococcota bacterium]|nr:hypothetical protein [Myxococcota bacterium]